MNASTPPLTDLAVAHQAASRIVSLALTSQDLGSVCPALLQQWVALAGCERARLLLSLDLKPAESSAWVDLSYPSGTGVEARLQASPIDAPPPWSWPQLCEILGPGFASGQAALITHAHLQAMTALRWGLESTAPTSCVALGLVRCGEPIGVLMLADGSADLRHMVDAAQGAWRSAIDATILVLSGLRTQAQRDTAMRSLHESDEGYRAIFDTASAGIARLSPGAKLLDANPRFCEIVGREWADLKGRSVFDITHPDDIAPDLALLDSALQGQTHQSRYAREKRYVRPDGAIIWVAVSGVVVRDAQGQASHIISVVEDITERKRYHDALSAVQAAERANRAKSEFLSRMSHELRTPLNAMLGFAQLLRVDSSQPLSITQRTKVEHIERAGAHLLAMINDVLDLSRIEAGGLSMSVETLQAGSVIEDALGVVSTVARGSDIHLRYEPPATPIYVRADRIRLRQVLVNLLTNAVKYNYPGGTAQVVVCAATTPQGRHIQFAISDTGVGLTPEQQQRLFEPFNRLGAERSGVEGTGIGLVVVKRLVELMQGGIAVESRPGRGTTFTVWLPQAEASSAVQPGHPTLWRPPGGVMPLPAAETDAEAFLTSPLPLEEPEPAPAAKTFTVLYAEDNEVNVELVRQVMRMRPNYQLLVAHSGAQAIELARSQRPNVMLMDMHLGDMSGLDVVAVLERESATSGIPRIALSADALPDQIRAARERGFRIYLTKPLDVGALLRALDEQAQAAMQPAA